jgi:hypothetical protein
MKTNRLTELSRIAQKGATIEYADTAFISPNIWLSGVLIRDFEARGLIERKEQSVVITAKGRKVLKGDSK